MTDIIIIIARFIFVLAVVFFIANTRRYIAGVLRTNAEQKVDPSASLTEGEAKAFFTAVVSLAYIVTFIWSGGL